MFNPRPDPSSSSATVERAAADWVARRDRVLTPVEAAKFATWRAADPRQTDELALLEATWRALDAADEAPEIMQIAHEFDAEQASPQSVALGAQCLRALASPPRWR
jgi:ferric-dicitrate binding protein FerR (iron transport regulator)